MKPGDQISQLEKVSIVPDDIGVLTKTDIANDLLQKFDLSFLSSVAVQKKLMVWKTC